MRRLGAVGAVLAALVTVFLPTAAVAATPAPSPASPALVLAFDLSRSVSEDQFADAKAAAAAVVATLAEDGVPIGLVSFGNEAIPILEPGQGSPEQLQEAIAGLTNDDNRTSAFSAVGQSIDMLAPFDGGIVVFITDGIDDDPGRDPAAADATVTELIAAAQSASVTLSAVNIEGDRGFSPEFRALVGGTGGTVATVADTPNLVQDLQLEIEEAAGEVRPVPEPLNTTAEPAPIASETPATETPIAVAGPPTRAEPWPREVALGAAGGMFGAAVIGGVVLSGIAGRASSPQARRARALEVYTPVADKPPRRAPAAPTRLGDNVLARQAVDVAGRLVNRGDSEARLAKRLEAADLALRPGEWIVIQAGISVLLGLLLLILTLGNPLAALVGVGLGIGGTSLFIRLRADRRKRAFHAALPDTLQLLASTLRVGHSLPQAMDSVVREGREPIRTEFQRALIEARLGVPAEKSLDDIADRVGSEDFRWVVMSIRIQREVGGNLAELLDTVAETIRERERLRRHVSALSAEGRLSAWIVGALPVVFVVYLLVARPGYLTPLVTDPLGIFLLVMAAGLFTVGLFGLRWATKVDL